MELGLILIVIALCVLMPIGAVMCFYMAYPSQGESPERALVKILLLIPGVVYPVLLLALHAASSQPDWKEFGTGVFHYIAKGEAAWLYFPLFGAANFMIALAIVRRDCARNFVLTPLSLLTCLMTCLFFTVGNTEKRWLWIFPLSASCGYAYGLILFVRSGEVRALAERHYFLIIGWFASVVFTVLASIARSKEIVADLPDTPPECFIVTAAARGHKKIVRSTVDRTTGQLTNSQLKSFRAFENWMIHHTPRVHRVARVVYNGVAPPIARSIVFRWQADLVYLLLKPLEWAIRCIR